MPKGAKGKRFLTITCEHCKKDFTVEYKKRKQRFCSVECKRKKPIKWTKERRKKQSERFSGSNNPNYNKHPKIKKNCLECDTEFEVAYAKRDRKFCSKKCACKYRFKHSKQWNEGHTKETHESLAKLSKTQREKYDNGFKNWNAGLTKEDDERLERLGKTLSNTMKAQFASGKRKQWHEGLRKGDEKLDNFCKSLSDNWLTENREEFLNKNGSKLENKFKNILDELKLQYKRQKRIGRKVFDFHILYTNILIEVDGNWHHANPKTNDMNNLHRLQENVIQNDKLKNEIAARNGYELLRFWEHDINNNIEQVKQQLLEKINET